MEEERIFVAELTGAQYTCGIGGICSGKCEESGKCGKGISRQEAIERIAKAYCSFMWGDRYSWEEVPDENKKYFYNFATVGLNALLEGK